MRFRQILVVAMMLAFSQGGIDANADEPAAAAAAAAAPAAPPDKVTTLPGVTVEKKMDPLSRSDRHLSRLKKSLPGTTTPPKKDAGDKLRAYAAAHADPNTASGQQRKMMEGVTRAPPEAVPGSSVTPP